MGKNLREGFAVQSPQGAELFEKTEYPAAVAYCEKDSRRWIQPVLLSEEGGGRVCQLPMPILRGAA